MRKINIYVICFGTPKLIVNLHAEIFIQPVGVKMVFKR